MQDESNEDRSRICRTGVGNWHRAQRKYLEETCAHPRIGQSYELIKVPASDDKGTLDHLAKYITGFFVAFRRF